jgi:hypothetical protein
LYQYGTDVIRAAGIISRCNQFLACHMQVGRGLYNIAQVIVRENAPQAITAEQ